MAFDFDSEHPDDPKKVFGARARGDDADEKGVEGMRNPENHDNPEFDPEVTSEDELVDPVFLTGADEDEDEDVTAEKREKARAASKDERLDKAKEKGGQAASVSEDKGGKATLKTDAGDYDETLWGRYQSRRLGISDHGDFLKIKGKGQKNPQTGKREFTDKQIERMLMKAVMQKGWTKDIAIMTNGRIDHQLTSRAEVAFNKMCRPGGPCEGMNVSFRQSLPDEAPPWAQWGLARFAHNRAKAGEKRDGMREAKKNHKSYQRCGRTFKRACEDTGHEERLSDNLRSPKEAASEAERQAREQAAAADGGMGVGDNGAKGAESQTHEREQPSGPGVGPQ